MRLIASSALLAVALATSASPGAHGAETRAYVAATGDVIVLLCSERPSLGGACFAVPAAHRSARIRISDASGLPVGGAYRFEAADETSLSRGSLCASATTPVPAGARTLTVFVDSARGPMDCPPSNGVISGPGTSGEVTVTWLPAPAAAPPASEPGAAP